MPRLLFPTLFCFGAFTCQVFAAPAPVPPLAILDDEAEPSCDVNFSLATTPGAAGTLHLEFDRQDDTNYYALDLAGGTAKFSLVQKGQPQLLSGAPIVIAKSNQVTLQRRPFGMSLLLNGETVLRAFDPTWTKGTIGTRTTGTWKIESPRVQPVEPIRFDDDFTRAGDGGDLDWKPTAGKWTLSAASVRVSARNADMSANPFAFGVEPGDGWAMTSAGRKFWNDYDARVAVRGNRGGTLGIAADVQDPKNYLAFTIGANANDKVGARRLVMVKGGKETVLAEADGGFAPRQWVQLGIRTSPGFVEGLLDGVPVLKAKTTAFGQGGVALLAKSAPALWDDVTVRSYDFLRASFAPAGAWSGANWNFRDGEAFGAAPNATLTTGRTDWNNYHVLVSTPWTTASSGSTLAGWRDSKNYSLIRWAGSSAPLPFKNKIEAVQVQDGVEKVVATAPYGTASPTKRLELDAENGAFSLALDGRARIAMPLKTTGKFGLKATATGTNFSDAVIFFPPPPDPPKIASKFVNDGFMLGWASSLGEWPATPDKDGLQFWNTAEIFGDWTLSFPWRARWRGKLEMALFADRGEFNSGLTLRGEVSDEGKTIEWTLAKDTDLLATATTKIADLPGADADGDGVLLTLSWSSGLLSLRTTKGVVFSLPVNAPRGNAMGLRASGFRVRTAGLQLWSANRDDFTFADAPTDFYSPSGKWSVFSRWPCYGDWSFFGGTGRQPQLWTKRTYGGDIVAEYYAHPQMDLPKEPGYSHPGDLNVSLCGDGQNPASGYAFVVSGHDNTRTQIYRAGKLVSDNTSDGAWFHDTINHNTQWHRSWVYVRAEARKAQKNGQNGVQVSLTVNNEPLGQFFDPRPLDSWNKGGRVCFWTLDSTLMLARAKIEAEQMGNLATPANLHDTTPLPILIGANAAVPRLDPVVETDESSAQVGYSNGIWRVENEIAGGPFAATLNEGAQKIGPTTRLTFDWRSSPDTRTDVYVRTGDDWHLIELSGQERPDAKTPSLGKMTREGESGGWTKMSFNLGAVLKGVTSIDEIRIGALHGDAYRWQGFDGNDIGAWYELKSLELK
ncbi:hypothetical protein IAD21_05321 [Abditibacteriota bacterium]|nr:hypothetical protein IAD21_05321 [Abditibacteriota bacterium]